MREARAGLRKDRRIRLLHFIVVAVVVHLGYSTWQQYDYWNVGHREARHVLALKQRAAFRAAFPHFLKGDDLYGQGDVDGAVGEYRLAIQIAPVFVEAYNNLGFILAGRGKINEATAHYQQALKIDPAYTSALVNLGVLVGERGDTKAAIEHLRKVTQMRPFNADAHYHLGRFLALVGNAGEAAEHFKETLKIDPQYVEAQQQLDRLQVRSSRSDEKK